MKGNHQMLFQDLKLGFLNYDCSACTLESNEQFFELMTADADSTHSIFQIRT